MARTKKEEKKEEESREAAVVFVLLFLTFVQFMLFLLMTINYHRYLMNRYYRNGDGKSSIRRINDISAVFKPLVAILFGPSLILLICIIPFLMLERMPNWVEAVLILLLESPFILIWLWLSVTFFKWLAVAHFGVIVDPDRDRIVFRIDQESYDVVDYLKLKFIRDLPKIDEIRLSDIGRITRKHGADLYIHGSFGSRRITFTNKQKRDECIYAITSSGMTAAKVAMEFERT